MYFKDIKQTCVHITHIYICVPLLIADRCFPPHVQTIQSVCLLVEPTDHVPKIGQHMGDAVTRHQDSIHHCIAWFFILQSRKVHSFLSFTKIETYVYTYIYIIYIYTPYVYFIYSYTHYFMSLVWKTNESQLATQWRFPGGLRGTSAWSSERGQGADRGLTSRTNRIYLWTYTHILHIYIYIHISFTTGIYII